MEYEDFLKADILCLLYDYGTRTINEINNMLGAAHEDVEEALFALLLENKVVEAGEDRYGTIDELGARRLKKLFPSIF